MNKTKSLSTQNTSRLVSRIAALQIFLEIQQGTSLKHALEHIAFTNLSDDAKGYARFLVAQTVRYHKVFYKIIQDHLSKKPQKKSAHYIYALLSLGCCELLLSQQKLHHTLSCFTDIAKKDRKHSHLSGMVRAILGKVSTNLDQLKPLFTDYNLVFGADLYKKIHADYGHETPKICHWLLQEPAVDILKLNNCPTPENYQNLSQFLCRKTDPQAIRPEKLGIFIDGEITIQSYASHLALYAMGDIHGRKLLDLCAAPGGKTLQAISMGANVTAIDISQKRLEKLYQNLERTKLQAKVICSDALTYNCEHQYDIILLDAPCSATGTIRKNPDILMHYQPENMIALSDLQQKILYNTKSMLKPNGILIYAVCSLSKTEGENQIQKFITDNPEFRIIPPKFTENMPTDALTPDGFIRLLPHHHAELLGHDGFFIAYLQKS